MKKNFFNSNEKTELWKPKTKLMKDFELYVDSISALNRYKSREVMVGNIGVGGDNPIRVQSMTTTDTMDTEATVAECIELINAGCEIIRITAPGKREAENLQKYKKMS